MSLLSPDIFGSILGMETYSKLYLRLLDSSVWKHSSDIRIVWITLLALKDKEGCVFGSKAWLADRARVDDKTCEKALKIFLSPDERSRTEDNDGRKIEVIDGGWRVLNHFLYRDGMEDMREKWRRNKADQRNRMKLAPGETLKSRIRKQGEEDPITKADKASLRRLTKQEGDPKPTTTFEREYDLDDAGDHVDEKDVDVAICEGLEEAAREGASAVAEQVLDNSGSEESSDNQ